jgi:hypothetical protein
VLDDAGAHSLFESAHDGSSGLDLTKVVRDWQSLVPTRSLRPSGVQGYFTSPSTSEVKLDVPLAPRHGNGMFLEGGHGAASAQPQSNSTTEGTGPGGAPSSSGESMVERWAARIAESKVGNPYQLAHMFRKYDTEHGKHTKTVLLDEFVQVIMDGNLQVPRNEAVKLSQALDRGDGIVNYMDFIHHVKAAKDQIVAKHMPLELEPDTPNASASHESSPLYNIPCHTPISQLDTPVHGPFEEGANSKARGGDVDSNNESTMTFASATR